MSKGQSGPKLAEVLESLSDVTLTIVADFLGDLACGGTAVALHLADIGVTVFPVGVIGEDEAGHNVLHALQQHKISTSGISRVKNYATPASPGQELLHGEHPALLNLVEHARKFATASDGMYVCDYGIGAASPRALNFIKSNGCMREKALVARSLHRLAEFEQLTAAVASSEELETAIGIEVGEDPEKLAVAAEGMMEELRSASFLAVGKEDALLRIEGQGATSVPVGGTHDTAAIDLLGAVFTAALAADAEPRPAAELAAKVVSFFGSHTAENRVRRDDLLKFVLHSSAARRPR